MKKTKFIMLFAIIITIATITAFTAFPTLVQDELVTVTGTFTDITRPNITLKADDGSEYLIHIGPIWYWDENKYSINSNSSAEIYGRLVSGKKEIYAYSIKQGGVTIKLADDSGNPLWWNDGKGKNRNNDWGNDQKKGKGNGNRDGSCGNCKCGR